MLALKADEDVVFEFNGEDRTVTRAKALELLPVILRYSISAIESLRGEVLDKLSSARFRFPRSSTSVLERGEININFRHQIAKMMQELEAVAALLERMAASAS